MAVLNAKPEFSKEEKSLLLHMFDVTRRSMSSAANRNPRFAEVAKRDLAALDALYVKIQEL